MEERKELDLIVDAKATLKWAFTKGHDCTFWDKLAYDWIQWRPYVNAIMDFKVSYLARVQ
jgi:hypothetical protein